MTERSELEWPGNLRAVTDRDAGDVRQLIGNCFAEYPGCVLDPDGVDAWMKTPARWYADKGGQFWVLSRPGDVGLAACVGWVPDGADRVELKNLYVGATARRQGLGRRLVALVEAAARERDCATVVLWTDTRFLDAHRLYAGLGYRRTGDQRALHDPSHSIEFCFVKRLPNVPPGGGRGPM
ncbi:MAG: GNAT family N-acetyltransferase [Actinomycetota bacterium]|nr:GNAT family N-acetyltransferase [Actinomycetota bacterium]